MENKIKKMQIGGKILAETIDVVVKHAKPGVSEIELDRLAEKTILERGGKPGFKMVEGYNNTICISTNDVVVHGVPTGYKLKKGDIVGIDCGVYYEGFHTDMSYTVEVGSNKESRFLEIGKLALREGIDQAKIGKRIGNISQKIQETIEKKGGYSVVRSLVGHGVGKELHEEPEIPGFLGAPIEKTLLLKEGMTIAIEVIYNMGRHEVVYSGKDSWTIRTADGSLSGLFEKTIAITKKGPLILTKQ